MEEKKFNAFVRAHIRETGKAYKRSCEMFDKYHDTGAGWNEYSSANDYFHRLRDELTKFLELGIYMGYDIRKLNLYAEKVIKA